MEAKLNFCGQMYTLEKFALEFCDGDETQADKVIETLVKQGRANWVENDPKAKENKAFMKSLVQQTIEEQAELHDTYDELQKEFKRNNARAGRLTYPKIELDFAHLGKAQEFQLYVANELRLESEIALRNSTCVLVIFEPTDKEYNAMVRKYKTENAINSAVGGVDKVATTATKAVDYTATKIVAPTVQVGAKAGVSILKTLTVTGVKATGTIISALAHGTKQCVQEIQTDPDVLRASRDLLNVKDSTMRGIRGHATASGSGVRIVD